MSNSLDSNQIIYEAIRKIALKGYVNNRTGAFRNTERKTGYVSKIHNDADDELCGTIDVTEFDVEGKDDGLHEGVLLSAIQDNKNGVYMIPMLYSEVVIAMDPVSHREYVTLYSHVDTIQVESHDTISVGVSETKEIENDDDSPDFDELEKTGNSAHTYYDKNSILSKAIGKEKESSLNITDANIKAAHDKASVELTDDNILQKFNETELKLLEQQMVLTAKKVLLGGSSAKEPAVLGDQLASIMISFIDAVSQIKTTTSLGPQPVINMAQFIALKARIQSYKNSVSGFLSKTVKVKE